MDRVPCFKAERLLPRNTTKALVQSHQIRQHLPGVMNRGWLRCCHVEGISGLGDGCFSCLLGGSTSDAVTQFTCRELGIATLYHF